MYFIHCNTPFQVPDWLHKSLHGGTVDGISPQLAFIMGICTVVGLVGLVLYVANHMVTVCANAAALKARCGELDKAEFKARNELLVLKREIKEGKHSSMMSSPRENSVSDRICRWSSLYSTLNYKIFPLMNIKNYLLVM